MIVIVAVDTTTECGGRIPRDRAVRDVQVGDVANVYPAAGAIGVTTANGDSIQTERPVRFDLQDAEVWRAGIALNRAILNGKQAAAIGTNNGQAISGILDGRCECKDVAIQIDHV